MSERAQHISRGEGLVIQELGNELLIYDRERDVAHCLAPAAARVWRTCEGGATLDEITHALVGEHAGQLSGRDEAAAIVGRALAELEGKGLLAGPDGGVSRRHVLKIAAVGAGALAAPLVVSAAVPMSAEAFGSPVHCVAIGSNCVTAGGAANSYGNSPTNICCGPGVKSCSKAVGTGTGGCYCASNQKCTNCAASGAAPTACGDGNCTVANSANRCCCSGKCNSLGTACA
ncbi:MAG: PqqD family protein [Solirubrobacteraceae bacterium]